MNKVYAGIGSRQTPPHILKKMTLYGAEMASKGFYLRSGNAQGADQAFALGANSVDPGKVLLYLPWKRYEEQAIVEGNHYFFNPHNQFEDAAIKLVKELHPAPEKLSQGALKLHSRNVAILLGNRLDRPVELVVYWSPKGEAIGGTGMGLRIAKKFGIPTLFLE